MRWTFIGVRTTANTLLALVMQAAGHIRSYSMSNPERITPVMYETFNGMAFAFQWVHGETTHDYEVAMIFNMLI